MRLIDADALYEELRYMPYDNILDGTIGHEKPLRAIIDAPTVEIPDWISVQDKLPDGECIAYSIKWFEMIIGHIYKTMASDTGYEAENENEVLRDISHWMPLPKAPSIEKQKPQTAKWLWDRPHHFKCSNCEWISGVSATMYSFCPKCGKKMEMSVGELMKEWPNSEVINV